MQHDYDDLLDLHTTLTRPVHYPQNPSFSTMPTAMECAHSEIPCGSSRSAADHLGPICWLGQRQHLRSESCASVNSTRNFRNEHHSMAGPHSRE